MGSLTGSSSDRPVLANGKPPKLAITRYRKVHMAFEGAVEIVTILIAWSGKVVFLNFMLTLLQCCVVIVMQIKLTVVVVVVVVVVE